MSISVNGQSCVPPGFRFHPTEEELLSYYLRKKVAAENIDLDVIRDVDLNKLEPWDIQEKCRIGSTPQNDWYFFSHKDKKYPTGTRTNRATAAGFWKATGRDKIIHTSCRRIGMRKTLVFYKGRAPHGQKSDWIMHEYRLDDHSDLNPHFNIMSCMEDIGTNQEDGWVVCRVFKKKNHLKWLADGGHSFSSVNSTGKSQLLIHSAGDDALEQILHQMGSSCKQESESINKFNSSFSCGGSINDDTQDLRCLQLIETAALTNGVAVQELFMKLPALESPTLHPQFVKNYVVPVAIQSLEPESIHPVVNLDVAGSYATEEPGAGDWAAIDQLLASQLDGQANHLKYLHCFEETATCFSFCSATKLHNANEYKLQAECGGSGDYGDLWSLTRSASSASTTDHIGRSSM